MRWCRCLEVSVEALTSWDDFDFWWRYKYTEVVIHPTPLSAPDDAGTKYLSACLCVGGLNTRNGEFVLTGYLLVDICGADSKGVVCSW